MVVGRTRTIVFYLFMIFARQELYSQVSETRAAEPRVQQPKKQNEGFVDYTLKRMNPTDKNYGECIDEGRRLLLTETLEKGYFWSNVVTLVLLLVFFIVIVSQWGLLRRRSLIYANSLCQYQSALARAEAHSDEATRRNHKFMEALRLAMDPAARKPPETVAAGGASGILPSRPDTSAKQHKGKDASASSSPSAADDKPEVNSSANGQSRGTGLDPVAPGLDLIAQNNALQQQLGLTQDQVKQLRRQLNESERQLQAEKQKSRTLKGE